MTAHLIRLAFVIAMLVWFCPAAVIGQTAKSPRLDLHGDPLPAGAIVRLGTSRFRTGIINTIDMSGNGKWIAVAGAQGVVFDAKTGKPVHAFDRPLEVAMFSRDSQWLVTAAREGIEFWDTSNFKVIAILPIRKRDVMFAMALSPDKKRLATITAGCVEIRDAKTGVYQRKLPADEDDNPPLQVTFLPDNQRLLVSYNRSAIIWEAATGNKLREISGFPLAISPDGSLLAVRVDSKQDSLAIHSLTKEKTQVRQSKSLGVNVFSAAFSPDNQALAVVCLSEKKITGKVFEIEKDFAGKSLQQSGAINARLLFSPDGKRIISAQEPPLGAGVEFWDRETLQPIRVAEGHNAAVLSGRYLPDGKTIATLGADHTVRLWDADSGREKRRFADTEEAASLAVSPDGKRLAWIGKNSFHVWNLDDGKPPVRTRYWLFDPNHAVFSPDGKWLTITTASGAIQLYDPATREFRRTLANSFGKHQVRYSADGKSVAVWDFEFKVLDAQTGKEQVKVGGEDDSKGVLDFRDFCFASDGRSLIALEPSGTLSLWDLKSLSKRVVHQPEKTGEDYRVAKKRLDLSDRAMSYSADGTALLATTDTHGKVRLFEGASFALVAQWQAHPASLTSVDFADGRRLLTAGDDTTALVWDLASVLRSPPTQGDSKTLWNDMKSADGVVAQKAVFGLAQLGPGVVPFLDEQLKETFGNDAKGGERIPKLLEELDASSFDRREKAQKELTAMGLRVLPFVRKQAAEQTSLEVRRRLERLVRGIEDKGEKQRWHLRRVVQVLEMINSAEARALLRRLAADGHETEMMQASLARLAKRGTP